MEDEKRLAAKRSTTTDQEKTEFREAMRRERAEKKAKREAKKVKMKAAYVLRGAPESAQSPALKALAAKRK